MTHDWHWLARAAVRLGCFVGGTGVYTAAIAASLALSPVRISLTDKQPISALTVRNDGDEPTVVQLDVVKWSQLDGKDVYVATQEILATPPIFTVPAGQAQLVRVGLRRAADPKYELSYRLFLQEVPPPPTQAFKGLRVALRFAVPIFVAPLAGSRRKMVSVAPSLQWRAQATPGHLTLNVVNIGVAHVKMTGVTLTSPRDSTALVRLKAADYVLPGQNRDWVFKLNAVPTAGTLLHISADTDAGMVEADTVLETP